MFKKLFVVLVCGAIVAAVWNKARVLAASEHVRDAWIASQDQQKLEHWDTHVQRQIRALRAQADALERTSRADQLAAEMAALKSERLGRQLEGARAVVAEFKARAEGGAAFSVAGQAYSADLAAAQLARYTAELSALEQTAQAAAASSEARRTSADQHKAQAAALRERIASFEEKARAISARRQVLTAQAELRRIEGERCAVATETRALDEIEALFRLAESELDRIEAEHRLTEKTAPARTLSLDESLPKY